MTGQTRFWNWFLKHEPELFSFDLAEETKREELFNALASELEKVDPDLTFEFGPSGSSRELIISAGGMRRAFPSVVSLVNAAPRLDRWQIIAFRPRRTASSVMHFRGKHIDVKDVRCLLLDNGRTAGIHLFIPGYRDDDADFKQLGYLLLDEVLGEYDVESKLGLIKMFPLDLSSKGDLFPVVELPTHFDRLVAKLEGRSGRAS